MVEAVQFREKKDDMLRIRCRRSTKEAFKDFVKTYGFRNMEDALIYLMKNAGWLVEREL